MEAEEMKRIMNATPLQFVKDKDELTTLQERWTSLIKNHGFKMIEKLGRDAMIQPDLFSIANEIDAFFVALKTKRQ